MNVTPDETSRGWSPMMIGGLIVGALILLLLIPTFRAPAPQQEASTGGGSTPGEDVSQSQCERTLISAFDGLQPNRLGISSEIRVMVDTLNNWADQCVDPSTAIVEQTDAQLRERLLTDEGFRQSQSERFQLRDAEHIRNSLLAAKIVERVTADVRSDEQRALALFYYVIRALELVPDDAPELLLTPYESLVYGLGTAADRGWTYALLMRQLRLDVVMIQPRGREETTYWLLGAVIPGKGVLLLDPRMGLPISPVSGADDPQTPLPDAAATLTEVRQDDQLLRQYDDGDRKYPLTAEDLQSVDVYTIGTSSTFAPRMGHLQAAYPEAGELFDGLSANELRAMGLVDRIVAAGADQLWTSEQVHVWPYPEQFWSSEQEPTEEQLQRLANVQSVLAGPLSIAITVNVNEQDQLQLGTEVDKPKRSLLEARIEQLLGNFAGAQQSYLQTRLNHVNLSQVQSYFTSVRQTLAEQIQDPQAAQQTYLTIQQQVMQQVNALMQGVPEMQVNNMAADMATYWAAQAQYEQHDYRLAAESAMAYFKRGGGSFLMSAIYLASLSLAQDGRPAEAVEIADQRPPQATASLGYLALVNRWRKLSGESDAPDKSAAEKQTQKDASEEQQKPEAESQKPSASDKSEPAEAGADTRPDPSRPAEDAPQDAEPSSSDKESDTATDAPADNDSDSGSSSDDEGSTTDDSAPVPESEPAANQP